MRRHNPACRRGTQTLPGSHTREGHTLEGLRKELMGTEGCMGMESCRVGRMLELPVRTLAMVDMPVLGKDTLVGMLVLHVQCYETFLVGL